MTIYEKLIKLQNIVKVGKEKFNSFGKYKYRSAEDIMAAVKPASQEVGAVVVIDSTMIEMVGDAYICANARLSDGSGCIETRGFAAVDLEKKGMDKGQALGAATSYASKYALQALLLLDDGMDNDSLDDRPRKTTEAQAKDETRETKEKLYKMLKAEELSDEECRGFVEMFCPDKQGYKMVIINFSDYIKKWYEKKAV